MCTPLGSHKKRMRHCCFFECVGFFTHVPPTLGYFLLFSACLVFSDIVGPYYILRGVRRLFP